jgi:predicted GNAT superfamily acetyltransferase
VSGRPPSPVMEPLPAAPSPAAELPAAARARACACACELRRLRTVAEFRRCAELQRRIWGDADVGSVSPLVMITAEESGGATFGAYVGDRLAGFVCGIAGDGEAGRRKLCSVLLGVVPELHGQGIARELKRMQRQAALAQGLDLITWTYDPLASRNAQLNIGRLGAVCSCYLPDCYGRFNGGINGGLATDRFLVEWWIREPRVARLLAGANEPPPAAAPVNDLAIHAPSALPITRRWDLNRREPALLVAVPADIHAIKRADLGLARSWQYAFREIFPHYFSLGYAVAGFVRDGETGRCAYVLRRAPAAGGPAGAV